MQPIQTHLKNRARQKPRRRNKRTRLYIDLEYVTSGYASHFAHSVTSVYVVLARYANYQTQVCFPSLSTIMRGSGIKHKATVLAAISALEEYRLVAVERAKGRRSNTYTLLDVDEWRTLTECTGEVQKASESGAEIRPLK